MDIEANFDTYMRTAIRSMKEYEQRLKNLQKQIRALKTKALPQHQLELVLSNIYKLIESNDEGIALVDNVIAELPLTISWVPDVTDAMEMSWETGITPWSVWLRHKDQRTEITDLIQSIKQKHSNGELEKESYPEAGMNVIICCKKRVYRGLIISVGSRLQVVNIDNGKEREEELDSCYKLLKEFSETHAHVIHCSVGSECSEKTWKMQFSQDFVSLLQYSKLTVKILNEVDNIPPTFIVDIIAFNEDSESEVSVSQWIFEKCRDNLSPSSELNLLNLNPSELNSSVCLTNGNDIRLNKANRKLDSSSILEYNEQKLSFSWQPEQLTPSSCIKGFTEKENIEKNRFLKVAHAIKMTSQIKDVTKNSTFKLESAVDAPEFLPIKKCLEENKMDCENLIPVMDGRNESSVLPAQYKPTDDDRICSYFARYNYCWKTGCRKEHVKVARDKWTDDSEELFCDTISRIRLPDIESDLSVIVSHVTSPNAFYVLLPQSHSACEDGENIDQLLANLNTPSTHKELMILNTPPCFGQFLIAFSTSRNQWERGSVYDVYDSETVQVFFVDSGITEDVNIDKCRAMLPQFNHLPSQAVYATLAGIYSTDLGLKSTEGAKFLTSYILNKSIEIHVADRNNDETRIEVEAFLNGENINEIMVQKGFCTRL